MKRRRWFANLVLYFLSICLFAACGDTGTETGNPAGAEGAARPVATAAPAKTDEAREGRRIVIFGDSLTAGYGLDDMAKAFPARVEALLREQGLDVTVVNAGLSGETTAAGLRRIDWILRQPADVFLIGLGANDFLRGLPLENTEANLRSMVEKVRAAQPGTQVALLGMLAPPNMGGDYARQFAAMYPELAAELDIPLYPFLLEDVGGIPSLNLPDGMHPNEEGHAVIARQLLPFVVELLEEQL